MTHQPLNYYVNNLLHRNGRRRRRTLDMSNSSIYSSILSLILEEKTEKQDLDNLSLDHVPLSNNTFKISNTLERLRKNNSDNVSIRTLDETNKAWMIKAAKNDEAAMLELLKESPELANQRDFISGYTALHWMAKHGNIKFADTLIRKYSADVNQKTHGGYTALHLARQCGHQELFDLLLEKFDADFTIRDNYGRKAHQYHLILQNVNVENKTISKKSRLKIFSCYDQCIETNL